MTSVNIHRANACASEITGCVIAKFLLSVNLFSVFFCMNHAVFEKKGANKFFLLDFSFSFHSKGSAELVFVQLRIGSSQKYRAERDLSVILWMRCDAVTQIRPTYQ